MTSVERIMEYGQLDEEAAATVEGKDPKAARGGNL